MITGEVRGEGFPAVLGAFRESAHYEDDLAEVMDHCAAALRRECTTPGALFEGPEEDQVECFVTALLAQVPDGPVVELVNRGHCRVRDCVGTASYRNGRIRTR